MLRVVEANFITSAVKPNDYPLSEFADFAFAGKSNVGKSSLLNTVLNRKRLAKTSSTPGKTKLINFFHIRFRLNETENVFCNFVDLPGYGYAKVSKTERNSWKKMLTDYFDLRQQLRGVFILVDLRHKADPKDIIMLEMLRERNIKHAIIATKSDKIAKSKVSLTAKKLKKELGVISEEIFPISSLNKTGTNKLIEWIEEILL